MMLLTTRRTHDHAAGENVCHIYCGSTAKHFFIGNKCHLKVEELNAGANICVTQRYIFSLPFQSGNIRRGLKKLSGTGRVYRHLIEGKMQVGADCSLNWSYKLGCNILSNGQCKRKLRMRMLMV